MFGVDTMSQIAFHDFCELSQQESPNGVSNPYGFYLANYTSVSSELFEDEFVEALNDVKNLDSAKKFVEEKKEQFFLSSVEKENPFSEITSIVGDDYYSVGNNYIHSLLVMFVEQELIQILLSESDIGISRLTGNYAEDWSLVPPNAESHVDCVMKMDRSASVLLSVDIVKLKNLSPIRKQSDKDMDLASKFMYLYQASEWVEEGWLTYNQHQMAKLLAIVTFDSQMLFKNPFLYKSEGGCGGKPPWNNLNTCYSGLKLFQSGKNFRTVMGVMKESVQINRRTLPPDKSIFVRFTHLCEAGENPWLTFSNYHQGLKKEGLSLEILRDLDNPRKQIPKTLLDRSIKIPIDKVALATSIAHLRGEGFIMTELDVRLFMQGIEKSLAIRGEIPIRIVLKEQEAERKAFKKASIKFLKNFLEFSGEIDRELREFLEFLPNEMDENYFSTSENYYRMHESNDDFITSFAYSDEIRIFKVRDVFDYFEGKTQKEFIKDLFGRVLEIDFVKRNQEAKLNREYVYSAVQRWVNEAQTYEDFEEKNP